MLSQIPHLSFLKTIEVHYRNIASIEASDRMATSCDQRDPEVQETIEDLVEKERCYDPAGLKSQPRKAESDLKHPRQKQFTCPFCKWSAGYYYAKFHYETRGGDVSF